MKRFQLLCTLTLGLLFLLIQGGTATAQQGVTVKLDPQGGSGVSGTATLTAQNGGTSGTLTVTGLAPGSQIQATLQAGTCAAPSASFAGFLNLTADTAGKATASGMLLFRGTDPIALATIADNDHIISISQSGKVVACGSIPRAPGVAPASTLLAEAAKRQVMQFNPDAALQKRIFADGFVPNSPEFSLQLDGVSYVAQRAENLSTGRVRVYYAVVNDWGDVRFVE